MTKRERKLIGKLWVANHAIQAEGGFFPEEEGLDSEDDVNGIVEAAHNVGFNLMAAHPEAANMGSLGEIIQYVKSLRKKS